MSLSSKIMTYRKQHLWSQEELAEKHLGGPYWCLMVAIYLGISFLTGAWHRTWILWPCASVLYAALCWVLNYRKENK